MTEDQIETLEEFIEVTLLDGSLPFTYPKDPLRPSSGTILVRFAKGGLPDYSPVSHDRWVAAVTLDILP
jgi:hypothetical protein